MRAVSVSINIVVASGDRFTPMRTPFEILVVDIDARVDDVGGNTLAATCVVEVFVKGGESEGVGVGDPRETPGRVSLLFECVDLLVAFDICHLYINEYIIEYAHNNISTDGCLRT